ncbi:DoxX family protein [Streptomyces sp. NPDC051940]|uniref:DoxX family protein n=1 Tax=Streptomyces sp. NPDC051940 TaxID=3155675 RepID=UPI003428114E
MGGRSQGFEDTDALTMVRVPSDPAQVSVNNVSFRVRLGPSSGAFGPRPGSRATVVTRTAAVPRVRPVVWSGRTTPGDPAAGQLLQAVRRTGTALADAPDAVETQLLPRFDPDATAPIPIISPRPAADETQLLPPVGGPGAPPYGPGPEAYDGHAGEDYGYQGDDYAYEGDDDTARPRRHGADPVRHAYYPGRRLNLGVVLLPLRIFLGFVAVYNGMGKLCDPLYFDSGERGRLASWMNSLEPWSVAQPVHEYALAHPVGMGLTVAFLQIVVGVLTVCGLWQRLAAGVGVLLAAGLVATISWRTDPSYDASEIIFLAAWSPLLIAGAPVYSVDARLAGQAWRRLGPRSALWELRRFVLRRGVVYATVVVGLTLLLGSLLGSAVRSSATITVPGPGEPPVNHLPGEPLPSTPGGDARGGPAGSGSPSPTESEEAGTTPSQSATTPTAGATTSAPGTVGEEAPAQDTAPPQDTGTAPEPSSSSGGDGSTGGTGDSGGTSGGTSEEPGLLGGLLG